MGSNESGMGAWKPIGTVIGYTSTDKYAFILKSMQARLGDIVACRAEVPQPGRDGAKETVIVWGRISAISRFNPFFPAEAAQELAEEGIALHDTVLSTTRDHLEAEVLILGATCSLDVDRPYLSPLSYPVKPASEVLQPPADAVTKLLTGSDERRVLLRVGTLIGRPDVPISLSAKEVVSRHLAILAMTGGGKTVAARRILRELIKINYPLIIFDPHGDYLGIYEKRETIGARSVKLFFPRIRVHDDSKDTISDLIAKMGSRLTDPQLQFYHYLLSATELRAGATATEYLENLLRHAQNIQGKRRRKESVPDELSDTRDTTIAAVTRNLHFVHQTLLQMEANNERLRDRFSTFSFDEMPDPRHEPEKLVAPGQVSIFYLAGYDHLAQSAIVSMVLEQLFSHRARLSGGIPPFQAVIEEAHNFIPSRAEGTEETPSLLTIRKVITEGRKFGTGLILISQRPARLDETTLAQCNSFLVLRLVNPKDKNFVRSVMENLSESDANILQSFAPGDGLVSGQAVRFPLLVKIDFDEDLRSGAIGDEDFINEVATWKPGESQRRKERAQELLQPMLAATRPIELARGAVTGGEGVRESRVRRKKKGVRPAGF